MFEDVIINLSKTDRALIFNEDLDLISSIAFIRNKIF